MSDFDLILQKARMERFVKGFEKGFNEVSEKTLATIRAMHKEQLDIALISRVLKVKPEFVRDVLPGKKKDEELIAFALSDNFDKK